MAYKVKTPKVKERPYEKADKIPMTYIKGLNELKGLHWFSKDTMKFFDSKVPEYAEKKGKKAYFISSEVDPQDSKRYTIRVADLDTGEIDTVGEFHSYQTKSEAEKEMKKILNEK